MKRILGLSVLALSLITVFVSTRKPPLNEHSNAQTPPPQVLSETPSPVEAEVTVTPAVLGDNVVLIANYKNSKTSSDLQTEYQCDYLVNAGFYTKELTPVGYFKSDNIVLRGSRESLLFDGFVTINDMGVARITRSLPVDPVKIALQSGPILIENAKQLSLGIKNDKEARRVFALVTGENQILFGMVASSTLEALPSVVFNWARDHSISAADAINLDGGSASAFRGPNGVFPEISPIGSAFCISL